MLVARLVVAAALAVPVAAFAQAPAAPPTPPKPGPEMEQLNAFVGNWHCEGAVPASPFGPAHKSKTDVQIHKDLGGFWVSGHVKELKTAESPMPIEGNFHQTYDPGKKQYVMIWVDNFGGWATSTSPGWEADKIAWTGESFMAGQTFGSRDTFTKKGPGVLLHGMEMQDKGQWTSMGDETCKKAAAK
jgi:hypothetical protein